MLRDLDNTPSQVGTIEERESDMNNIFIVLFGVVVFIATFALRRMRIMEEDGNNSVRSKAPVIAGFVGIIIAPGWYLLDVLTNIGYGLGVGVVLIIMLAIGAFGGFLGKLIGGNSIIRTIMAGILAFAVGVIVTILLLTIG